MTDAKNYMNRNFNKVLKTYWTIAIGKISRYSFQNYLNVVEVVSPSPHRYVKKIVYFYYFKLESIRKTILIKFG